MFIEHFIHFKMDAGPKDAWYLAGAPVPAMHTCTLHNMIRTKFIAQHYNFLFLLENLYQTKLVHTPHYNNPTKQ